MSEGYRTDRCANPFRKPGEKGHVDLRKDLRKVSRFILAKFPDLPENSRLCSGYMKRSRSELRNIDISLDEPNSSSTNEKNTESPLETENDDPNESHDEVDRRSTREIVLEEMLNGLKQKFSSLIDTDPLKIQILTIASSAWSVRKII